MIIINDACLALIRKYEGCRLKAYLCPANVPTIGWGSIQYPPTYLDGRKVKLGDTITQQQADEFLMYEVNLKAKKIDPMLPENLTGNQFAALISFAYNLGEGALKSSTLLKKVNANANDVSIVAEFAKWCNITKDGKLVRLPGLADRRKEESLLYFKK